MENTISGMSILLTNDDGIDGEGLKVLADVLESFGANICIMAPASNQSGVSSLLTMTNPLVFKKLRERRFSCSGSPVDCVVSSLVSDIFGGAKFDCVISGINKGANLGTDTVYSGTCAAARQAALYNLPGIALSVESYDGTWKFKAMAEFCAKNLKTLIALCENGLFVSVNAQSADCYSGVEFASLAVRDYQDRVKIISDPNGDGDIFYGFFSGGEILSRRRKNEIEDDFSITKKGLVSITRLFAEPSFKDESKTEIPVNWSL